MFDLDGDIGRPRVHRVLHEFLDRRGRSFHDLTCGDQIGDLKIKDVDDSHFLCKILFNLPFS